MEILTKIADLSPAMLFTVAFGGAVGAFIKDVFQDGALILPYKKDGKLYLGFIAGALVGAFVGIVVDHSFLTAALGGFTGSAILKELAFSSVDKDTVVCDKTEIVKSITQAMSTGANVAGK